MSKRNIVFVRPPNLQKSGQWQKQNVTRCPLNIALLASYVRSYGDYDCCLVDFEVLPCESIAGMAVSVAKTNPDYVCITTLTPRFPTVVRMAREIKKINPGIVIIAGGPHVTGAAQNSLHDAIDYGIIGEGEEALLELLQFLDRGASPRGIKNLVYRDEGNVRINRTRPFIKDLDALPFAAWDLMNMDEYKDPAYFSGSHLAVYTGRGCPYDCSFCASAVTWKRKLRLRSVENVMAELRQIVNNIGIRNLMFWDDTFAVNMHRALDICRSIIKEGLGLQYTVQIRADSLTNELALALRDSGCKFAAIGVESGNEQMLAKIGKKETIEDFRRAVRIMKDAHLPVIASYILGLPGDTHETIRQTLDLAFELDADQSKFMILAPFPGTRVYELASQIGLVDPWDFEQMESTNYYDSVGINLSAVSNEDLLRYQDEAYQRFDRLRGAK